MYKRQDLYGTDFTGPAALVMGAEGEGMRRLTEENCDFLLRIPMKGSVPCLNVSVATGVCLYEILRDVYKRQPYMRAISIRRRL